MIQYVLTENINEHHDIVLLEIETVLGSKLIEGASWIYDTPSHQKVWGAETVPLTFSVYQIQILITLFFREYFCQLLCHALCEYGGINYFALWVDEIHGREP